MTQKVKALLDDLVARISTETTANFIRDRLFTDDVDIPCRHWSPLNQFFVSLAGTADARGIRQWNTAGRRIKKGAKALYILIPIIKSKAATKKPARSSSPESEDDEESVLSGFRAMPVFKMEDTEGESLPYEVKMRAFDVSSLPLIEVARELGVTVSAQITSGYSGVYNRKTKEITLGTDNPQTFLHELSHAVDCALPKRREDYAFSEVVAELSSCFLGALYGVPVNVEATKAYIQHYTGRGHVAFRIMEAMGRVESIYGYIEKVSRDQKVKAQPTLRGRTHRKMPAHTGNQSSLFF
jgi:antirestriction protein ArdC